ncbi:hypothetical protein NOVO_08810 [Rickettsiales bacterium Ac37b]|nr:hypothetical protein NOVO_08810 [Rickettsiales bacterium Ac37b]
MTKIINNQREFEEFCNSEDNTITSIQFDFDINDDHLKTIANSPNCYNLQHLDLSGHLLVKDEGIKYLSTSKYILKLESLDLSGTSITDKGLAIIANAQNFINLKDLELYTGPAITDEGIKALQTRAISKIS